MFATSMIHELEMERPGSRHIDFTELIDCEVWFSIGAFRLASQKRPSSATQPLNALWDACVEYARGRSASNTTTASRRATNRRPPKKA